jgi:hypothetical protein
MVKTFPFVIAITELSPSSVSFCLSLFLATAAVESGGSRSAERRQQTKDITKLALGQIGHAIEPRNIVAPVVV